MNLSIEEIDYIITLLSANISYLVVNKPEQLDMCVDVLKKFSILRKNKEKN